MSVLHQGYFKILLSYFWVDGSPNFLTNQEFPSDLAKTECIIVSSTQFVVIIRFSLQVPWSTLFHCSHFKWYHSQRSWECHGGLTSDNVYMQWVKCRACSEEQGTHQQPGMPWPWAGWASWACAWRALPRSWSRWWHPTTVPHIGGIFRGQYHTQWPLQWAAAADYPQHIAGNSVSCICNSPWRFSERTEIKVRVPTVHSPSGAYSVCALCQLWSLSSDRNLDKLWDNHPLKCNHSWSIHAGMMLRCRQCYLHTSSHFSSFDTARNTNVNI